MSSADQRLKKGKDFQTYVTARYGELYTVDVNNYNTGTDHVPIKCSLHGTYGVRPVSVMAEVCAGICPVCIVKARRKRGGKVFAGKAEKYRPDTYDFTKMDYTTRYIEVELGCKLNPDHPPFKIIPQSVFRSKTTSCCPVCNVRGILGTKWYRDRTERLLNEKNALT